MEISFSLFWCMLITLRCFNHFAWPRAEKEMPNMFVLNGRKALIKIVVRFLENPFQWLCARLRENFSVSEQIASAKFRFVWSNLAGDVLSVLQGDVTPTSVRFPKSGDWDTLTDLHSTEPRCPLRLGTTRHGFGGGHGGHVAGAGGGAWTGTSRVARRDARNTKALRAAGGAAHRPLVQTRLKLLPHFLWEGRGGEGRVREGRGQAATQWGTGATRWWRRRHYQTRMPHQTGHRALLPLNICAFQLTDGLERLKLFQRFRLVTFITKFQTGAKIWKFRKLLLLTFIRANLHYAFVFYMNIVLRIYHTNLLFFLYFYWTIFRAKNAAPWSFFSFAGDSGRWCILTNEALRVIVDWRRVST